MPVAGRKPKPDGQKRTRHPLQHEFVEVLDVPFGDAPDLPAKNPDWRNETRTWWASVSRMPHCILWTAADWQFASDSALVYEDFLENPAKNAAAMLNRDKQLGTTLDFRRDLRIRYVSSQAEEREEDASVTAIAEYRAAVSG